MLRLISKCADDYKPISFAIMLRRISFVPPPNMACSASLKSELQQLVEATERGENASMNTPQFLRANVDWHMAVATASHNELLRAFMHSISNMVYKATAIENFANDDVRKQVMHAHRRIMKAIVAQDAEAAERRMALHLFAVTAAFRASPNAPLVLDF